MSKKKPFDPFDEKLWEKIRKDESINEALYRVLDELFDDGDLPDDETEEVEPPQAQLQQQIERFLKEHDEDEEE